MRQRQQHQGGLECGWIGESPRGGSEGGDVRSFAAAPRGRKTTVAQDRQGRAAVSNLEGPLGMRWPRMEVKRPITHRAAGTNPRTRGKVAFM